MFQAGAEAMEKSDSRTAENDFTRAHELDPSNQPYLGAAKLARQSIVSQLIRQAEKEKQLGHKKESVVAIQEALRLEALAVDVFAQSGSVQITSSEAPTPIELMPTKGQHTFDLRTAAHDLILQVLNAYGLQGIIDGSVKNRIVHFSVDDVEFTEAAALANLVTNTFFVPLDALHVMVVADTQENRSKYEQQVMETIYFHGLNAGELNDMANIARNIFGVQHDIVHSGQSTMTIRASELQVEALNHVYEELLMGRSELQLDVHLYEVDRTKKREIGAVLPNSATLFNVPSEINSIIANNSSLIDQIVSSGLASAGDYPAIIAALIASGALSGSVFNNPFAVFGGGLTEMGLEWNSTDINMLLNSSDARSLDQVQVRVLDQEEATIRSGTRYPIMTSSYSGLASSSSNSSNSTIPQIEYEDLGLTLKVKTRIGRQNKISLNLDLKVSSLEGSSINGIPILNNRQYVGTVFLDSGDSVLIGGTISKQDSVAITGIPGLNDIPGFGATDRQHTEGTMELIIIVTPHIVRLAHQESAGPMMLLPQH